MTMRSTLCSLCFLLTAVSAEAAPTPVVTVGTPGDSLLSTPTKPTPALGRYVLELRYLDFLCVLLHVQLGQGLHLQS